jgi:hypothetical protein
MTLFSVSLHVASVRYACRANNTNSLEYRTWQCIYDIVPLVEKRVYEEGLKLNGSH